MAKKKTKKRSVKSKQTVSENTVTAAKAKQSDNGEVANATVETFIAHINSLRSELSEIRSLCMGIRDSLNFDSDNIKVTEPIEVEQPNSQALFNATIAKGEAAAGPNGKAVITEAKAVITKDEIMQELQKAAAVHGLDKVGAIVAKYGSKRVGDLAESNYAAVLAEAKAL